MSSISIIGSGWVGSSIGIGLEQLGNNVTLYDIDKRQIEQLKERGHKATSDLKHAVSNSCVTFVCVPTPSHGYMNLKHIISAIRGLAKALENKPDYHLVVIKSTVVPTTTERTVIPLLTESGKKLGEELGLCVNPEFLTENTASWTSDERYHRNFFSQDSIIIGEYDKKSGHILEQLYKPLEKPIFRTNLRTAEMIKYAANCMLATKISFWNEFFLLCQELGIDSQQVADIVAVDPRIGKYGSVHGKAFGGKCLSKDLEAFVSFAQQYHNPVLLTAVKQINAYMAENYGVRE